MMWIVVISLSVGVSLLLTGVQCRWFYEKIRARQRKTRVWNTDELWTEQSSLATTNPEAYVRDASLYGCVVLSEEQVQILHNQMERNPLFLAHTPRRSDTTPPPMMPFSSTSE